MVDQEGQLQGKSEIETLGGNEKASLAKMETKGGGPILGKRGRAEGTNSSKTGNEQTKKQGNRNMEEKGQGAHDPTEPIARKLLLGM